MALLPALAGVAAAQGQVAVDSSVVLLVGAEESGPVGQAAEDLARDFEKVFGKKPAIVHDARRAAPVTIVIETMKPGGSARPESFSIAAKNASLAPGRNSQVVQLTGADMRGTIFAVYQFAQEYLGVDPLYYWTDHEPARRSRIEIPASLNKSYPAPVIKYRGFFINDEDLLTGWAPGSKADGTGISLEVWNKIYETILRLKGNIVAPGTWIFPDEPQIKLAGKRGLILTEHHAIPLGVNVARWPRDVPYAYSTHPEILERAWKNAVAAYPAGQEVLWTVGLRGLSDSSYAAADPTVAGNNEALGKLISKAIAEQMRIVREKHRGADFITNLWQEGARLVHDGYLTIPKGVGTVWADDGYGYLQDRGQVTAGQGAYYHVAMMNGRANQLTEMVPVERINAELGRYIKAGATNYMLMNTSDIRPVSMTMKAVMDLSWQGMGPESDADKFYRRWSADEFGEKAADEVAAIYRSYFAAPAHLASEPAREYGDQYYHTQARSFLLADMIGFPIFSLPGQSPLWTPARVFSSPMDDRQRLAQMAGQEEKRCQEAQPRWDALWTKAAAAEQLVLPERRPFYRAHVLAMIAINRSSNRMLALASEAVQQSVAGNRAAARAAAERSLGSIEEIGKAEAAAEYGKWKNWYRGDWLTSVDRTGEMLRIFIKQMDDPLSPLPPPIRWDNWEAYHHIMGYEGARVVDIK
jgi:hypothetical protein